MRVAVIPSLGTRNTCDLIARIALLGATIAAALSACSDEPEATPTLHLATTPTPSVAETPAPEPIANGILDPTPVPTVTYTPTVAPAATPTLTPANTPTTTRVSTPAPTSITLAAPTSAPTHTPTAPPTPSSSPTSTSIPTSTSTPEATPTTSPTHAPTASPTPASSPTPTARESAVAHFTQSISWFGSPPDFAHAQVAKLLILLRIRDAHLGNSVARLPWLADDINDDEWKAFKSLIAISYSDLDLADTVAALPWFTDGITHEERVALISLSDIAFPDPDLAETVAALPWFTDGITQDEESALHGLSVIESHDLELAALTARLPWFADEITDVAEPALRSLNKLAIKDAGLATFAAGLPWFADNITIEDLSVLKSLNRLASADTGLAVSVAGLPWFADGITRDEYRALVELAALASEDARLAVSVVGLPWFADGGTSHQNVVSQRQLRFGAGALRNIADIDRQSAALLLSFAWVAAEDFSGDQLSAITLIRDMFQEFPTVAKEVLGLTWVRDDMTRTESWALGDFRSIARNDLELAWHVLKSPFMEAPFLQRDAYALEALNAFSRSGPPPGIVQSGSDAVLGSGARVGLSEGSSDVLAQLAGQSWFSDGLDDEDAALLHGISHSRADFRQALIETNYVVTASVALPLTGEMGLAVVRHTPFPPDDQILKTLEQGVRIIEDFMGAPLPVGDVTLLLVEPEFWFSEARAEIFRFSQTGGGPLDPAYVRGIVTAANPTNGPPTRSLYHELGHYYLELGPRWLQEGLANFLEAYTVARTGGEGLGERLAHLELSERCAENIWDHVNPYRGGQCNYELGEKFLLGMYAALGPEAVSAALRELYTRALTFERLNHDSIYYAFQSNVPFGKEESFRTAWLRYHGSPVIDRVYADSPDLPPLVALYNATDGEHWVDNRNWLTDAPLGAWYGVYTNSKGQVTGLKLAKNGLAGELPSELGGLSNLIALVLNDNRLSGEIPLELGDLIHLGKLRLEWNELTGEIPPELGNLTNLRSMGIYGNRLTGEIPPELGKLAKLGVIWLHENQFTGCIAAELPEIWKYPTGLRRCDPAGQVNP